MPGYIKKKLREYGHLFPEWVQNCPYSPEPTKYCATAQEPLPTNTSPPLDAKGIKKIQKIVGSILYYAQAVEMAVLMALSLIAIEQKKAMETIMD
jgi:hypothetical protein